MDSPDEQEVKDAEWCDEEGIPTMDEPFIQKYLDGRDALIEQERQQRSDHAFRTGMTPMQREAAAIVSAIRFEEQQTLWRWDHEDNQAHDVNVYPGMMFLLAKDKMEKSKLWQIVKKMPKGALLHCHLAAMGDLSHIFEVAMDTDDFCISADTPLTTPDATAKAAIRFKYVRDTRNREPSIWKDSYEPHHWVPIAKSADAYPDGGREGFVKCMISRLGISPKESLDHNMGVGEVWRKFTSSFRTIDSLLRYEPIFRRYIFHVLTQLNEDGVRWVDFRCDFFHPYTSIESTEPDDGFSGMLNAFSQEVERFKISEEGKGFWGARIIWTGLRMFPTRAIAEDMKRCIEMKKKFPNLIAGYDLVGPEELGRPLADLVPELFWFKKQCREAYIDIPFYFHSGETLGSGDEVDENLFDAVILGTRRIGHGFSLYKHPLLMDMVKDKRILIESCPISNEVLRLTSSILSHPLPALLARGIPCCLSNDDPSLLGHNGSGMSHDFWQALQGWENLGLEGLASMAENSVRWATFDDCDSRQWQQEIKDGAYGEGARAKRMKEWAMEFERFCQWVVLEFGAEQELNTLD